MPATSGRDGAAPLLGMDRDRMVVAVILAWLALVGAGLADATLATEASHAPRGLVTVGLFVTAFGTSGYMFAYAAALAAIAAAALARGRVRWCGLPLRQTMEGAVFFLLAVAASGVAAQALKHALGRARPVLFRSEGPFSFHPLSLPNDFASFPSGHTTSAFAAAVALGLLSPRRRWWLLGGAVLIGASRVLVGAHYPSDVVGGATLGSLAAIGVAWACARRGWAFTVVAGRAVPKPPAVDRHGTADPDPGRAPPPPAWRHPP